MRSNFIYGFAAGYIVCFLALYLRFGYFSLSFAVGSFMGIALFAIALKTLKKRKR